MKMPCYWAKPTTSTILALVIIVALAVASPATAVPTGEAPSGVGINERTNRIYVTNYIGDSVSVINGYTNTSVATIPVGSLPEGLVVNPETNRIFVSNYISSSVSVIDGATDTVVATIPVGSSPRGGMAIDLAMNRIFVANGGSGSVSVLDGAKNKEITTIHLGAESSPHAVGFNSANGRIYVAHDFDARNEANSVSVIDGETYAVVKNIPVGSNPVSVAANANTNRVYVANNLGDTVSIIDGATDTVVKTLDVECCPFEVVVDEAGNRIFVTNAGTAPDNTDHVSGVAVIDGDTDTLTGNLLGGDGPFGVDVNPRTQRIYISNFSNNNVSVLLENELLQNPSFELHTRLRPDFWLPHNLDCRFDRWTPRVDDYDADASFRLTGAAGVVKWIRQEISASGPAGTRLHVEGFSKAARRTAPSPTGGHYAILTTVFYSDGSSKSLALNYTKGPHGWERRAKSIVTEKDFDRIVVRIIYANQEGAVWFDGLHVWTDPPK